MSLSKYNGTEGLDPAAESKLQEYGRVILELNELANVTGAKTVDEFLFKHVLDSALALKAYEHAIGRKIEKNIYDVGSGGGVPGIVLAILRPESKVFLVERRTKKAAVLQEAVRRLKISNTEVLAVPFEEASPSQNDTSYWFRAFLPGQKLIHFFSDSFDPATPARLVFMKGPLWQEEKLAIKKEKNIKKSWVDRFERALEAKYELPDGAGSRNLVIC